MMSRLWIKPCFSSPNGSIAFTTAAGGRRSRRRCPFGLNFASEKRLQVRKGFKGEITEEERELLDEIAESHLTLKEAEKRWRDGQGQGVPEKGPETGVGYHLGTAEAEGGLQKNQTLETGRIGGNREVVLESAWMKKSGRTNGCRRSKNLPG
jgi:hypothetical protein